MERAPLPEGEREKPGGMQGGKSLIGYLSRTFKKRFQSYGGEKEEWHEGGAREERDR